MTENTEITEPTASLRVIEVHNVWTIYTDYTEEVTGSPGKSKLAMHSRPQDWGHPRWVYRRYRFEMEANNTRYINHFHGWTDAKLDPASYPKFFSSLLVQIFMPGCIPELCGKDYLGEEDFWKEEWGVRPIAFHGEEEEQEEL